MRLLPELYRQGLAQNTLDLAFFKDRFSRAHNLAGFTFERYPAGGVGENELYADLRVRTT